MWRELLADENVSIANPDFCPVFLYILRWHGFRLYREKYFVPVWMIFLSICLI